MTGILQRLLVAIDGSPSGSRVVSLAIAVARRHYSEIILCYALGHHDANAESGPSNADVAASVLAKAAKRVSDAGLVVRTLVLEGEAAESIVACATEHNADGIVMGTQGKRGLTRFFMGSTADGVLRRTDVPTLFVPSIETDLHPEHDCILVAVDDSDPSDAAAAFAIDLAKVDVARLVLCGVVESSELLDKAATYGYDPKPMLEELRATTATLLAAQTARALAKNVAVESVLTEGDVADNILKTAELQNARLIVVGTHSRRGLRRLFVGSVAESIVRRSPVPVAVLRSSHLRAAMDISR